MLSISNLQEACEVLSRKTGRNWTDEKLLDFAQHIQLPLSAASPIDSIAVEYSLRDEDGRVCFKEKFRWGAGDRPLLRLFPRQVMFLLIRGEVIAQHVDWGDRGRPDDTIELIEPGARIFPKDVRVSRSALHVILQSWHQSQIRPGPISGLRNGSGEVGPADTSHRWPAWVFDDEPSAYQASGIERPRLGEAVDRLEAVADAAEGRLPTKKKGKKPKYSPSTVLQLREDLIAARNGSWHGVTQALAAKLGVSETTVKTLVRKGRVELEKAKESRKKLGPWAV